MYLSSHVARADRLNGLGQVQGAFLIDPISCGTDTSVVFGKPDVSQAYVTLMMIVAAEPKLRVLSFQSDNWLKECTDDKRNNLMPKDPRSLSGLPGSGWSFMLNTNLPVPAQVGKKIAVLKGEITCTIQTQGEVMEIADLTKLNGLVRNVNGAQVTITNVTNKDNQLMLDLTADSQPSGRYLFDLGLLSAATGGMDMIDEHGKIYHAFSSFSQANGNMARLRQQSTSMHVEFDVPHGPKDPPIVPSKLRWEIPTATKDITVDFELHNLDLPHFP
jgi:hypothetical protein